MRHYEIIGYAYEADLHCPACAAARFGGREDDPATEDSGGNPVYAIFAGGVHPAEGEYCGTCRDCIVEPLDEGAPDSE